MMPLYYHYTDEEGVQRIIQTGKIMASLNFMSGGDTAHGNGVYFTKLEPKSSTRIEIAKNNWMNSNEQFMKKTEYYFVVDIPESEVKDTKAKDRNIFLFGNQNDLRLHKYPWWLKNYDSGQIIASYKYQVMSFGPASEMQASSMGVYTLTEETVNGRPVYQYSKFYLFMDSYGNWLVSDKAGDDSGCLFQQSQFSLGPDQNLPWEYSDYGWHSDVTLKVFAWQK